jgi:hypothetical protein
VAQKKMLGAEAPSILFSFQKAVGKGGCQNVTALIIDMALVSVDPHEANGMDGKEVINCENQTGQNV